MTWDDMYTAAYRVKFCRESAQVERCHTKPYHGSYSTGAHSFNMLQMLLLLHPSPSIDLIKAVAFHDTAERVVGDLPWMAKNGHPDLRREYEEAEEEELEIRGLRMPYLTHDEKMWLKQLDLLEFYFWALDQIWVGNCNFSKDVDRCEDLIDNHITLLPELQEIYDDWNQEWTDD